MSSASAPPLVPGVCPNLTKTTTTTQSHHHHHHSNQPWKTVAPQTNARAGLNPSSYPRLCRCFHLDNLVSAIRLPTLNKARPAAPPTAPTPWLQAKLSYNNKTPLPTKAWKWIGTGGHEKSTMPTNRSASWHNRVAESSRGARPVRHVVASQSPAARHPSCREIQRSFSRVPSGKKNGWSP